MLPTTSVITRSPSTCSPLESESCKNGGRCLQTANSYRCICNPGFTGAFCEMSKLENLVFFLFYFLLLSRYQ